jgi:hypothetical protein
VLKAARLSDLAELGTLSPRAAAFLEASVRAGLNVLVAGGTQAGQEQRYCATGSQGRFLNIGARWVAPVPQVDVRTSRRS